MEPIYDQNLVPRLIISFIAFAIAVGPMVADFNKTHATNPLWPPHARFHVVWQVLTQSGVSILALVLLWRESGDYLFHLYVAAAIVYIWIATFFATLASMRLFAGALRDTNGIEPFRFNIGGKVREVDTNLFGVVLFTLLNSLAVFLIQG